MNLMAPSKRVLLAFYPRRMNTLGCVFEHTERTVTVQRQVDVWQQISLHLYLGAPISHSPTLPSSSKQQLH